MLVRGLSSSFVSSSPIMLVLGKPGTMRMAGKCRLLTFQASPLMRASSLAPTFPLKLAPKKISKPHLYQHLRRNTPVMISAALFTTHSNTFYNNNNNKHAVSLSVLPQHPRTKPGTPFPSTFLAPPLGSLAYFSTGGKPPKGGGRGGMLAGIMGAGALLLGKGKYLVGALKLTKLSSLASMFVSIGAYSMIFGVPYACGMVGLIFVHETGHLLAMRHYNIPFSPMVFLPFMGAVIAMKDMPRDAWQDAVIAFGGPAMGTAGAAAVALGANMTDSQLLYALADFGFMVNLFNMMPLGDMDGGRITGALSPYFGVAGLAMGGGLIATGAIHNPIIYLIMLSGGWSTFQRFYDPAGHRPPGYYKITDAQRAMIGSAYFGLIGVMIGGMAINAQNKKSPEEIQRQYKELSFDEREF